ncbi:unnamed protein product [Rhizoctonia solani]|uniref:Uncharacterized protein n=1 Tax=Rhizoctonia solani TaxID=456999 RepID=A0A8H3HA57_9AGAM|nr:unnamed protein product [Rhizoctonia solani]
MFAQLTPHATPSWYQRSLSCVLHQLAQKTQGVLPPEVCTSLGEASGRVFIQESYINDMQAANPGRPISSDPLFVYNGYNSALSKLFGVLTAPGFEGTPRGQVCHNMHAHLQKILSVVHARGNDVNGLFKDPNMGKALADFANVLSAF